MRKSLSLSAVLALILSSGGFATSIAQADSHSGGAFAELAACARSEYTTDVNIFFLIDSSASLRKETNGKAASDPDDVRAEILSQTIEQLSDLNTQKRVNFALDTFDETSPGGGGNYKGYGWTEATSDNVAKASSWVKEKIPGYDSGNATNWLEGLKRATKQLAAAPRSDGEVCQAIIWFTDGGLDVDNNPSNKTPESEAIRELCGVEPTRGEGSTSGVIETLRADGVNLIGVLLTSEKGKEFGKNPGFDGLVSYFGPIVTGEGDVDSRDFKGSRGQGFQCGRVPVPASYASGEVLVADDPDALARQFIEMIEQIVVGAPIDVDEDNKFYLDKGVSDISIVIPVEKWDILRPNNLSRIAPSSVEKGFRISNVGKISVVRFENKAGFEGEWRVNLGGSGRISVFMQSGLRIKLDPAVKIEVGKGIQTINGTILDAKGKPADLSVYTSVKMRVIALDESGMDRRSEPRDLNVNLGNATWSGPFEPFSGGATSKMRITIFANTPNLELPPVAQNFNPPLLIPDEYGKVLSPEIRLSNLVFSKNPAIGEVIVTGAKQGTSAVKFAKPQIVGDFQGRGISDFEISLINRNSGEILPFDEWLNLTEEERVVVEVRVDSSIDGDGEVLFNLPAQIRSSSGGEVLDTVVKASFLQETPQVGKWWLIALFMFLGTALPLLLMQLVNYFFSRFKLKGARVATVPVVVSVTPTSVTMKPAGARPSLLVIGDFQYIEAKFDSTRQYPVEFQSQVVATLSATLPKNPFGTSTGLVQVLPGSKIASSEYPMSSATGTSAGAALNPNRYFFAVAQSLPEDTSSGSYEIEASLTVFMSTLDEGNADGQIAEMLATIKDSSMWSSLADSPVVAQTKPVKGEKAPKEKKEKKEKKAKKEKVEEAQSSGSSADFDPDDPWA
jgi:ribosomal protein L12E/L44/L45/RPP1/RPP2